MITLPEFSEGIHYRSLRGGRLRFELLVDDSIVVPVLERSNYQGRASFRDCHNREWAHLDGCVFTARAGYAWNGATPKKWIPLIGWVGVPDPPSTRRATLYHDICFQFMRTHLWPAELSPSACNELFLEIMQAGKFRFANTYFGAVKDFGKLFTGEYPAKGEYSVPALSDFKPSP